MRKRKAFLAVCDDVFISLSGKLVMNGVYTSDIGIAGGEAILPQIVFVFMLEMFSVEGYPLSITTRVTIPGNLSPLERQFNIVPPPDMNGRKSFSIYLPVLAQNVLIRPGQIEASVIFPDGEFAIGSHLIVSASPAQ